MEVDLAYFDDPAEDKSDAVDDAIGELSAFHEMNGVYAQGVSVRTAVLPQGWRGRVVPWSNQSTGRARAAFLEPHDCVVSKLVAYREKDLAFAAAMLDSGLIDPRILAGRIDLLPASLDPRVQPRLRSGSIDPDWTDQISDQNVAACHEMLGIGWGSRDHRRSRTGTDRTGWAV
jgi:hypothetical protein